MTHNHSDDIHLILKRKNDACAEFLSATILLKKALEAEEMAAVAGLIERRAALIKVVAGLDREIAHCQKTDLNDRIREIGPGTANIFADLSEKFRQIRSSNRDCEIVAADRLLLLRKELQIIHEKEEGLCGYNSHVERIPRFLNIRT
jgi:hypothetical protein